MNEVPKNWSSVVNAAASNWTTMAKSANDANLFLKCTVTFGYILSCMAISVHLFVHISTDLFQNFPGNLLVSNCVLLLIQYCFSMSFLVLAKNDDDSIFNRDAVLKYDYYVTTYIWSVLTRVQFAMAFDLWKCLKTQTTNARLSKQRAVKFVKYSLCCWLSPFVEWGCLWLVFVYALKNADSCRFCAQNSTWAVFMVYYVTDFALMILNFTLYLVCLYYIYKTTSSVKSSHRRSSNFLFYFKICGRLFVMSEVNYTLLIFVNHFQLYYLRLLFDNFMAYHGAIVFATIVFQKSLLKYRGPIKSDTENTATLQMTG